MPGEVGAQKPRASEEPGAWRGLLLGEGGRASQGRRAEGLGGHLNISPIWAGSSWHHRQLSEPRQRRRAPDAGSAALDLCWGEVRRLPSQKLHLSLGLHDATCPWEGNSCKRAPHRTLSAAPNSWDKTPCSLPSEPAELFPGKRSQRPGLGGDGQPCRQHLQEHGPFYSSLRWPLHVQPYVSHMITKAILTGRIIFIFLIQQPANSLWLGDAKNGSHFLHLAK